MILSSDVTNISTIISLWYDENRVVLHKIAAAEEIKQRRVQKLEQYTSDIMYWGLWQSEYEVDEYMRFVSFVLPHLYIIILTK